MTRSMPKVLVSVLNWNGGHDTVACLRSVQRMTYANFGVLLVDNGSKDGSLGEVRELFPDIEVLENDKNLGYAGGNNVALRYALDSGADYVLLLNNDTVVREDLLDEFVQVAMKDDAIGVLGAKSFRLESPGKLYAAYGLVTYRQWLVKIEGAGSEDSVEFNYQKEVEWVSGCGMMLARSAIEEVGLLDEAFFAYHEDVDWCVRARKSGYRVVYVPTAVLWHKGAQSTDSRYVGPVNYFHGRNSVLFLRKHASWGQRGRFFACFLGVLPLRFLRRVPTGEWRGVVLSVRGLYDGLRGNPPPLAELGLL